MPREMTIDVATYEECERWALDAVRLVRCSFYPFVFNPKEDMDGFSGFVLNCSNNMIFLTEKWEKESSFKATYLHEVAHVLVNQAGLRSTPTGKCHNKYFAALLWAMYSRAGYSHLLKVYDFGDSYDYVNSEPLYEDSIPPPNEELIGRFGYILTRGTELARSGKRMEECAEMLMQDHRQEWMDSAKPAPWLWPWPRRWHAVYLPCFLDKPDR